MSAFELPKTPGGTNFGTIDRFRTPHTRSPGPLSYEPAMTLSFSHSTLSVSNSQPCFSMPGRNRPKAGPSKAMSDLHIPGGIGTQPNSKKPTAPVYSMGKRTSAGHAQMPSPLQYRLPVARVYETRGDRNFGTDDRFGDSSGPRSAPKIPGPSDYIASDTPVRSDTHTLVSVPFGVRGPPKTPNLSPGPQASGDGFACKMRVMQQSPVWSCGLQRPPARLPLEPSSASYDQRSLYWSGKRELGKPTTAPGRHRPPQLP
jgi:hypothetical protein